MNEQKYLGPLVAGLIGIGTIIVGLHDFVFTRSEGEELARQFSELKAEIREDVKGLRDDVREFTKAAIGGKHSASAKPVHTDTKLTVGKPEARPGTPAFFQALDDREIRRQAGHEYWLNSFGDDLGLNSKRSSK